MSKITDWFLGVSDDSEDDNEEIVEREEDERKSRRRGKAEPEPAAVKETEAGGGLFGGNPFQSAAAAKKPASVVNVYSQKQYKVIVFKPCQFSEAESIARHLKERNSVIINLEKTDGDLWQRIIDFISGTTFALEGKMQKIGEGIFMFVPSNVDINDELSIYSEREMPWQMNR
ncbi:MAG: cell division protein SepF [Gracilibacteraceae bacterium]|jgi:cell division inhibitor SepF|nr:cell division protein SepF [Gracilibacteraceae bacterium]